MSKRIALPLLFALLYLGLAGTSALAAGILFTTMPPETPSPVGFGPLGPPHPTNPIPAVSWNCADVAGCNVDGISYWEFDSLGLPTNPTLLNTVNLSLGPYQFTGDPNNFAEFSSPLQVTSAFSIGGVTLSNVFINVDAIVPGGVHVPQGTSWITLYGENTTTPNDTFWSSSGDPSIISTTLSQDPMTGVITGFPSQLTFTVTGSAAVPEPGSMLLLGSGIVGLAGVVRRKLMR